MGNDLLDLTGEHIILDRFETWPEEIKLIIEKNKKIIYSYLEFEDTIDKRAQEEIELRYFRLHNKYESDWSNIIDKIEHILKNSKFVGFHCTRLTDEEINNIMIYGLKPLSTELLKSRLEILRNNGSISKEVFKYLIKNNHSYDNNRKGKVFFFHASNTLKCGAGLYRLFRSWGGEALYIDHEKNFKMGKILFKIGKPCIAIGSLRYEDIDPYPNLAEKFISIYFNVNNLQHTSYDFDDWMEKEVRVLNIITLDDELFEKLTKFSTWNLYF